MLRQPAVSGSFYPSQAGELTKLVRRYAAPEAGAERVRAKADGRGS